MVAALGIRLQPYMTAVVVLGVGMAALGGALFAPITTVHPAMGAEIMTVAFVVVIIGGLGSFWGVVLAALLVGVVRGVTIHFVPAAGEASMRSEEHTSELQSLMRISYAVFCLKKH